MTLQINDAITNPLIAFFLFMMGISGFIILLLGGIALMSFFREVLLGDMSMPFFTEPIVFTALTLIFFLAVYAVFSLCYSAFYKDKQQKIILVSIINAILALWSVLLGTFFMFAAMQ